LFVLFRLGGASYCLSCILVEGNILESRNHLFFSISLPVHEYVCWLLSQLQLSAKSLCKILPGLTTVVSCPAVKTILGKNGGVGNICHHLRVQRYHPSKNKYNQRMRTPTDEDLGDDSIGPIGADSLRSIQLTQIRSNESDTYTPTSQQQYELMYCLWVMSLDVQGSSRARADFQREGVVAVLADLIAVSPREKTVRLALSILKNLADCNDATTTSLRQLTDRLNGRGFLSTMIGCGILKSLQLMATRQWNDQDMENGK
jgi:V-ATPase subunit H